MPGSGQNEVISIKISVPLANPMEKPLSVLIVSRCMASLYLKHHYTVLKLLTFSIVCLQICLRCKSLTVVKTAVPAFLMFVGVMFHISRMTGSSEETVALKTAFQIIVNISSSIFSLSLFG